MTPFTQLYFFKLSTAFRRTSVLEFFSRNHRTPVVELFFNKITGFMNSEEILRMFFLQNTFGWLLLLFLGLYEISSLFFYICNNWDLLHVRLNSHHEAWSYRKKRHKKIKAYRKSVQKEPSVKMCLLILDLKPFRS